jgi:DUF971 family protein
MSKNDLKSNKLKKAKKYKIKINYSDSHDNETYLWPGEHRLKSSTKKKKCKMHQVLSPNYNDYVM